MILDNGILRAEVRAEGALVASLRHLASGAEVLARTPWDAIRPPIQAARDEAEWLARWSGGWPVMVPNAGDAGDGHGFHGEGSTASWEMERDGDGLRLSRRFLSAPIRMTRDLTLQGDTLLLDAEITADAPCAIIWGEHVTLGGDLLAGPLRLATSASRTEASADYVPPESPLAPGASGPWPHLPGRHAPVDLSAPGQGWSALACLQDLGPAPWVEARADHLAVRLDWTPDPWPLAWAWIETGGDRSAPWFGRGRCLGIEPCTTWPATGLARARTTGAPLLTLAAVGTRHARLSLRVFQP